jgi:hypothetical protein
MRLSFFKTLKAKPFEYKPLYYDQKKDKEKDLNQSTDLNDMKTRLRAEMNEKWAIGRNKAKQPRGAISQRSLIIYLAIALMLIYFIFR